MSQAMMLVPHNMGQSRGQCFLPTTPKGGDKAKMVSWLAPLPIVSLKQVARAGR